MKKLGHDGFAFLDSMLMIIIVGMITGVGLYVYNSLVNTQETFNAAANARAAKPTVSSVVKIPEWGVELTVVGSKDVIYEIADNVAWMSTKAIQAIPECKADYEKYKAQGIKSGSLPYAQGIAKRMGNQKPYAAEDEPYNVGIIYANSNKIGRTDNLKFIKINENYYQYTRSNGVSCTDATGNKNKVPDFATALQTIKPSK